MIYFPNFFGSNEESLIEEIRECALKKCDELINKKNHKEDILHLERSIYNSIKCVDMDKLIQFDKGFYTLINNVALELKNDPLEMSVMQFYQFLEDAKKRNTKPKTQ